MKKMIVCAALLLAAPAMAADIGSTMMSPKPATDWTGFYAGINAGGAWSMESGFGKNSQPIQLNPTSDSGYIAGIQAGYNYQIQRFIFGFELDLAKASATSGSTRSSSGPFGAFGFTTSAEAQWLGSARIRMGIAATEKLMIYGMLGIAAAEIKASVSSYSVATLFSDNSSGSDSANRVGWVAGAGAAYKFTDKISLTGEVAYYDFGTLDQTVSFPTYNYYVEMDGNISIGVARAALNYHF